MVERAIGEMVGSDRVPTERLHANLSSSMMSSLTKALSKQLLTFSFADPYCIRRPGSDHSEAAPRVTVVGPQTRARAGLSACGRIDNFTIHFQITAHLIGHPAPYLGSSK